MRDRAAVVGGDLTAGPTADGWQVTAVLPREVGAMTTGTATAGSEDR
jgi:signal transduction histidine kinase